MVSTERTYLLEAEHIATFAGLVIAVALLILTLWPVGTGTYGIQNSRHKTWRIWAPLPAIFSRRSARGSVRFVMKRKSSNPHVGHESRIESGGPK